MRTGQARRRDANEPDIISALEAIGVIVRQQSGDGLPDLLTNFRGTWLAVEVKMPGKTLTASQLELYRVAPFPVVESVSEALALFGVVKGVKAKGDGASFLSKWEKVIKSIER